MAHSNPAPRVEWRPSASREFPVATPAHDKLPLTVAIIALNAAAQIGPCLASVGVRRRGAGGRFGQHRRHRRDRARATARASRRRNGSASAGRSSSRCRSRATTGCCASTSTSASPSAWRCRSARRCGAAATTPGAWRAATASSAAGSRTARAIPTGRVRLFHRAHASWSNDEVHEAVLTTAEVGPPRGRPAARLGRGRRDLHGQAEPLHLAARRRRSSARACARATGGCSRARSRASSSSTSCAWASSTAGPGFAHIVIGCNNSFHKYLKLIELREGGSQMTILVTGGAGFIGSNFVRDWLAADGRAGRQPRQADLRRQPRATSPRSRGDARHAFVQRRHLRPRRSLQRLLRRAPAARDRALRRREPRRPLDRRPGRRSCRPTSSARSSCSRPRAPTGARSTAREATPSASCTSRPTRSTARSAPTTAFTETTPYEPNSPYSASKAASDHLVRAYHHTYGLPTLTTNCSNNYGPYQFPEKLIPLMIANALEGKPLPVYGDGENVRDWLYVDDHCEAIRRGARARAGPGETYNIGGNGEQREPRRRARDLRRCSTSCAPARRAATRDAHHVRRPTARATTGATRSTRARSARELGWTPRETFETRPRARPCAGTSTTRRGSRR